MKKIFSLLTLLLAIVTSNAYAGDVYTAILNNGLTESTKGYFTISGSVSWNKNYTGTYAGTTFTKGLKMQSDTKIEFKTTAEATVTIVQSLANRGDKYVKLDNTSYTASDRTDDATNKVGVYEIKNVAAGSHSIVRAGSEMGLLYVKVEYTGAAKTQLTTPTFTFDNTTGTVTIAQKENKDVYYTTDNTTPSSTNGTKYSVPFTVEDGTTVKAIAPGDGTSTIDSDVAELYALLKTVTIQQPTIATVNGTVAISCATPGTIFKYSVNGGAYVDYSYPFTLTEDATVKAQASRENCTTVESDPVTVEAVKKPANVKTIILDWSKFKARGNNNKTQNDILNGNEDTDAYGYSIELNNNQKAWQNFNKLTIDGTQYTSIKLSNGAENILHLPEGVKVARITFYSVVNGNDKSYVCGWKDVNGPQEYKSIPMGAWTNQTDGVEPNCDVRVYGLDNVTDQISFTNTGLQLGFVIALDIIDETVATTTDITLSAAGMGTFSSTTAYELPEGLTAYTATCDGSKVTLTKVEDGIVAANQGVVLSGEKNGKYTLTPSTTKSATDWTKNELKNTASAAVTTAADDQSTYVLIANNNGNGQFARLNGGQTIPVGKAYLTVDANAAKTLSLSFGETNGINAVENNAEQNGAYYTLSGQQTVKPAKGLYIHNGKKYIAK